MFYDQLVSILEIKKFMLDFHWGIKALVCCIIRLRKVVFHLPFTYIDIQIQNTHQEWTISICALHPTRMSTQDFCIYVTKLMFCDFYFKILKMNHLCCLCVIKK
jgi:hypothetical protein